jgi:hypothetical protein
MHVEGENPLCRDLLGRGRTMLSVAPYRVGPCVAWLIRSLVTMAIARHPGSTRASCGVTHS